MEVSAAFCGIGAPFTAKLPPGSDSNAALSRASANPRHERTRSFH